MKRPVPTEPAAPTIKPDDRDERDVLQHQVDDLAGLGAERHADADLVPAAASPSTTSRRRGRAPPAAAPGRRRMPESVATSRSCSTLAPRSSSSALQIDHDVLVARRRSLCTMALRESHRRAGRADHHAHARRELPLLLRQRAVHGRLRLLRAGAGISRRRPCRRSPLTRRDALVEADDVEASCRPDSAPLKYFFANASLTMITSGAPGDRSARCRGRPAAACPSPGSNPARRR